jgi:hypothetical protein
VFTQEAREGREPEEGERVWRGEGEASKKPCWVLSGIEVRAP